VRTLDGQPADWRNIRHRDAISIIESEDRFFIEIIILDPPITGIVNEMYHGEWIIISGNRYYVSPQLGNVAVGATGRFWLNENGEVFGFEATISDFIYIVAKTEGASAFAGDIRIQVYCNYTGLTVHRVHDRVMIDGISFSTPQAAFNAIPAESVASLSMDADGVVREINPATPYGERVRREFLRFAGGFIDSNPPREHMPFRFNYATEFFVIPENRDPEHFGTIINFVDGELYNIQAFELDERTGYVRAVVVVIDTDERMSRPIAPATSHIAIVTRVAQVIDRNEQTTFVIEGYRNGEAFRYYVAHFAHVFNVVANVRRGDVILFNLGYGNEIIRLEHLAGLANQRDFFHTSGLSGSEQYFAAVMRLRRRAIFNDVRYLHHELRVSTTTTYEGSQIIRILAHTENPDTPDNVFLDYYVFDRTRNTIIPATIYDIVTHYDNAQNPSSVYVFTVGVNARIVVIVRD